MLDRATTQDLCVGSNPNSALLPAASEKLAPTALGSHLAGHERDGVSIDLRSHSSSGVTPGSSLNHNQLNVGGPCRNRTYNQWIKSPLLCLIELTARAVLRVEWGGRWDSNPRRPDPQSGALPTELRPPSLSGCDCNQFVARPAGLEPATLGLEGRCSIRLSYERYCLVEYLLLNSSKLVGADGFEPPTLCSQSRCATRLRHAPTRTAERRN